jgi:hypothetical protein
MSATKTFDCVEMKAAIQARLLKETEGMTDEEERAYTERRLRTSDSPAARLWRTLVARQGKQQRLEQRLGPDLH